MAQHRRVLHPHQAQKHALVAEDALVIAVGQDQVFVVMTMAAVALLVVVVVVRLINKLTKLLQAFWYRQASHERLASFASFCP